MKDALSYFTQLITNIIFNGYGFYSILFVFLLLFLKKNDSLKKLDDAANKILIFSGIVYSLIFLMGLYMVLSGENEASLNYMFGPRWFFYWLQPTLWIVISQLLWIKKIRNSKILRLLISILLILSFEKYVIIATSLERDYIPPGWNYTAPSKFGLLFPLLFSCTINALTVISLAYFYSSIKDKIKKQQSA